MFNGSKEWKCRLQVHEQKVHPVVARLYTTGTPEQGSPRTSLDFQIHKVEATYCLC